MPLKEGNSNLHLNEWIKYWSLDRKMYFLPPPSFRWLKKSWRRQIERWHGQKRTFAEQIWTYLNSTIGFRSGGKSKTIHSQSVHWGANAKYECAFFFPLMENYWLILSLLIICLYFDRKKSVERLLKYTFAAIKKTQPKTPKRVDPVSLMQIKASLNFNVSSGRKTVGYSGRLREN